MIRLSIRFAGALALGALSLPVFTAAAQQDVPAAPTAQVPSAPAPAAAAPVFPKLDPANFNAAGPSVEAVNNYWNTFWGWQDNIAWQVQAILKTPIDGLSQAIILTAEKGSKTESHAQAFFITVDGKHVIVGNGIIPSNEHPFAETRAQLQQRADGPYRGAASKDLELVEFAAFQCPYCKAAQANMEQLAVDFPKARIVFQNSPLPKEKHPADAVAAAYGVCVSKQGGSGAFFTFAAAVFEGQDGLASADGATLTLNSAATKAGLVPAAIATCAADPATVAAVEASSKLAQDLGIYSLPALLINGRPVPANAPYETLKKMVLHQAKLDGVAAQ